MSADPLTPADDDAADRMLDLALRERFGHGPPEDLVSRIVARSRDQAPLVVRPPGSPWLRGLAATALLLVFAASVWLTVWRPSPTPTDGVMPAGDARWQRQGQLVLLERGWARIAAGGRLRVGGDVIEAESGQALVHAGGLPDRAALRRAKPWLEQHAPEATMPILTDPTRWTLTRNLAVLLISGTVLLNGQPLAAQPAPSVEQRIEHALGQLDHRQYRQREAATKALLAIGEAALPALRELVADREASAEARNRARRLVTALDLRKRWRELPGGEAIDGVVAKLMVVSVAPRESWWESRVRMGLRNTGDEPIKVLPLGFLGVYTPIGDFELSYGTGRLVMTGKPMQKLNAVVSVKQAEIKPIELAPGAELIRECSLRELIEEISGSHGPEVDDEPIWATLKPGPLSLQLEHHTVALLRLRAGGAHTRDDVGQLPRLRSNKATLSVRDSR